MANNRITIQFGGPAGYGIKSVGTLLAKTATRMGLFAFGYAEYPSLIRGGHNTYQVVICDEDTQTAQEKIDFLICLDGQTFSLHEDQLAIGAGALYDGSKIEISTKRGDLKLYNVPLLEISLHAGGSQLQTNSVALGALVALLDLNFTVLEELITQEFGNKGKDIIDKNIRASRAGFDYVSKKFAVKPDKVLPQTKKPRMYLSGNEAMAMGAIAAGCRYYSAYPMTPATSILEYMEKKERSLGLVVKQLEDEIAVINSAIGASWAGVRSFIATSGGGFSLMVEALGMAAMTETPFVVAEVCRSGPSTGMPTWTGQEDLKFVLGAGHGEFDRFVIAPGDTRECYELTAEAFNLSDIYQVPTIILSDKYLAESFTTTEKFTKIPKINRGKLLTSGVPADYNRYALTTDGISPRAIPGAKNSHFLANSYEHDEAGFASDESQNRQNQMDKRAKKLANFDFSKVKSVNIFGDKNADICLIGWGSTKNVILETLAKLRAKGRRVKFLQIIMLNPFPVEEVKKELAKCQKIYVIENNQTGQLADLIAEKTQIVAKKITKYNGRPFFAEEILEGIK